MASVELTSTGRTRQIEQRSGDRVYYTSDARATRTDVLLEKLRIIDYFGEVHNNRRTVFRARCAPEVVEGVEQLGVKPSVKLPLSELGMGNDVLATFDHNVHPSDVPEWDAVYTDWQEKKEIPSPLKQIESLPKGYTLTNHFEAEDAKILYDLWKPFGWTKEKINSFISTYKESNGLWVSGVRDEHGQLASACMGEALYFDGIYMVEATEFGTRKDLRRQNLSSVAVIGLNAQIVDRAFHKNPDGTRPLIISEYNMDPESRSDKVGRKTGMTIPGVDGVKGLTEPIQILRKNVSVFDGGEKNDLDLGRLSQQTGKEYDESYKYLRNFIVGMMTSENMDNYYSPDQVQKILACMY